MANEKNINSRIQHKHDIETNWLKATTFIPKQGELIIYDIDENYNYERIKIGDGINVVNSLPFITDNVSVDKEDLESFFFIVETVKENDTYYLSGITFEEIIEKFNNGGNMVCHVDGTDYIPLLSVTPRQIIFSGIYNTTSVSLVFNTEGVGTLTSTHLADNTQVSKKADKSDVTTNLRNGESTGSIRGINTLAEDESYKMGENAFAIGNGTKASGKNSFASGQDVEATGSYAHAEGYATFATAAAAHAEGYDTHATARYAHAEGASTTASGNNSHAEGNNTTSSGHYSHAEGNFTTAAGAYSHAEGNYAETGENGTYAHAEGSYTKATKTGAHAEGNYTEADGTFAHTEGYYTKASSPYQHVRGKYNIVDSENIYSTIIGNGTSEGDRKNIYTLDWDGNGWFANNVAIGENKASVITEEDFIIFSGGTATTFI